MSEPTSTGTSNMVPGGVVVIPSGRIAAWRYRRALMRHIEAGIDASLGDQTLSGLSTYVIALTHPDDPVVAETNANLLTFRAQEVGLFAVVNSPDGHEFRLMLEGPHAVVRRFLIDFYYRSHLNGVI